MEMGESSELNAIRRIGIVGAGLMGHGIAQVFASAGYDVNLYDADRETLEAAKGRIESNFKVFIALGLAKPQDVESCLGRISLCPSLEALCSGCQYILEAILEDLDLKKTVFAEVERLSAPDAIFSSNTSAISITEIAAALKRRDRFLGTHFWNPPHVLPCVEVIRGDETGETAFETVFALMEKVGKVPVRVLKDVPGFLGNRLQHAMWREAVSLCDKGVASAEDIDKVVKYGFGARMPFIGPMETADLAGLVLTRDIHKYLFPHLESTTKPAPVLERLIAEGATGVRAGRGFYEWTSEKIEQIIRQRDTVLLRILHEIIGGVKRG
ncbi:MAG: putative 3-hydroxybutyryl-CoA dehydrogenase [Syntrophaceae bacterium PtaU1.Bin231]|nr:MAG: putative 3-hydroxybutyryl-CoA dehydrogenase [Syntrophaceae bacterium PtaU1.Bin231]